MISPRDLFFSEKIKEPIKNLSPNSVLFLFGCNSYAPAIIRYLATLNYRVKAIFDNHKAGTALEDVPVILPQKASLYPDALVIIASKYYDEMFDQLMQLGYHPDQILRFFSKDYFGFKRDCLDPFYIEKFAALASYGEQIRQSIQNSIPGNPIILYSPLQCIGDMYVMCLKLDDYLKTNAIHNYVIAAPGNAACDLARRFGHTAVYRLTMDESTALMIYWTLMGESASNIRLLNLSMVRISPFIHILGCTRINWVDHYNKALYQLDTDSKNKYPTCEKLPQAQYQQLLSEGFAEGSSVIFSPYAGSMPLLEETFWENLASALTSKGFQVYTNTTASEKEISGTRRLEIPLRYIDDVLEKAGTLVALRSGFCDVTSQARCKKIILYSSAMFHSGLSINVFGLNRMGLCADAFELAPSGDDDSDIKTICTFIQGDKVC